MNAALAHAATRRATQPPISTGRPSNNPAPTKGSYPDARRCEFVLLELRHPRHHRALAAALHTVATTQPDSARDNPSDASASLLWERHIDSTTELDQALADLGRSLTPNTGTRMRALLIHEHRSPATTTQRLFLALATHPATDIDIDIEASANAGTSSASWQQLLTDIEDALDTELAAATLRPSPAQLELLSTSNEPRSESRHVEQLTFDWHGPLDAQRFTTAWQSVYQHETVLRAAFDWTRDTDTPPPRPDDAWIVLHEHAEPDITHHLHGALGWNELLEADLRRGFDLRQPALLRTTLLHPPAGQPTTDDAPPTRILLTYHHTMIDNWSAHLLLRAFHRAYHNHGTLPGGERRPDIRDHARWLATQTTAAAHHYWSHTPPPTTVHPIRHHAATATTGAGTGPIRQRQHLSPYEAIKLRHWAATWGSAESTALQAAWALLLHHAAQPDPPAPPRPTHVGFAITTTGRTIPLPGIEHLPGPLQTHHPITVAIHPTTTIPQLLRTLRDTVLDLTPYEWTTAQQAHHHNPVHLQPQTLITHHHPPPAAHEAHSHGIHTTTPQPVGTFTGYPLTLTTHHDTHGTLTVTATYDRAHHTRHTTARLLTHYTNLLRAFPHHTNPATTITALLQTTPPPPATD
ncbi:condensation domain-containing protein [Kitasatospora sp. NPDC048239]|uniref:condensation domain-containing protein n=1 Tax=Kitasatospora sp. NPDC048239 TaxID=3364046 RepID=UPI00371CBECF